LQGLVEFSTGVLCWDLQQNGGKLISLDTLYTQACMLVPIFNVKVQQVAQGARGSFPRRMMGAAARNMLIPAHEWDRSGWFSLDTTRSSCPRVGWIWHQILKSFLSSLEIKQQESTDV